MENAENRDTFATVLSLGKEVEKESDELQLPTLPLPTSVLKLFSSFLLSSSCTGLRLLQNTPQRSNEFRS